VKKFPFLFMSDTSHSAEISRAVKSGLVRKIGPKLYTSNLKDAPEQIVRQNIWQILSLLIPGTVVSHRSAIENKISPAGCIYVTGEYRRTIDLPGLKIFVQKGPGPLEEWDSPILNLYVACRERAYLENLLPTKDSGRELKVLSRREIEERLAVILGSNGEAELNRLRDRAREVSKLLGLESVFTKLNELIGAIQGTKKANLSSLLSKAHSIGEGYDPKAVERFAALRAAIADAPFPTRKAPAVGDEFYTTAFFDAYFSNFIEGTEFLVEEAYEIIDSGIVPPTRPEDGHDILGTYRIVGSIDEMTNIPDSFEDFEDLLISRHAVILEGRPDKRPGQYKLRPNIAGLTRFVEPALVRGTLRQGFELYRGLVNPFARALAMMFFVLEVHPFDDGNGRIARAMMNAELVASGQVRIIIPSVFRNEYLSGLKRMTNERDPVVFVKQMQYVQDFISRIDFSNKDDAIEKLRGCNAFAAPADNIRLKMPAS
jgi:hypothetical protein